MHQNPVFSTMRLIARIVTTLAFDLKAYGIHLSQSIFSETYEVKDR